jgi:aryl-alcohol dehydrogenase-like predicted oxidoreductase
MFRGIRGAGGTRGACADRVLKNPVVTAPIVGATKPHHLSDAVAALDVHLTDEEIRALEEPYGPDVPTAF